MKKFKFEIAQAAPTPTYTEVEPISFPTFVKSRGDINPAITRIRLDGSMVLEKDDFDTVMALFSGDYVQRWLQYRVSQDISGTYGKIIEGYCNIDSNIDHNRKQVTLTEFSNEDDNYDLILNNYENDWSIYGRGITERRVYNQENAFMIQVRATTGTGLTQVQYRQQYTVNGFKNLFGADPRWAYFLYSHTIGTDEHVYLTLGFDFSPDGGGSLNFYTYNLITVTNFYIGSTQYTNIYSRFWVKLPSSTSDSDTTWSTICVKGLQLEDLINTLLDIIDSSLNFTASTGITYTGHTYTTTFNPDDYFIAEAKETISANNLDAKLSLKQILDWFDEIWDLYWYMDSNELKFIHRTELATSGTLDLSTETAHLQQTTLIETDLPTYEIFTTPDARGLWSASSSNKHPFGSLELTYLESPFDGAKRNIRRNEVNLNTNIKLQKQQNAENETDGYELINADFSNPAASGAYPLEKQASLTYGYDHNYRLAPYQMFAFNNKSRYGDDADLTDRLKVGWNPIINIEAKPLYKMTEINYNPTVRLDLFDFNQSITTALGASQAIELRHDLGGGKAVLTVEL